MEPASIPDKDIAEELCHTVKRAASEGTPLRIQGADTKAFYGRHSEGLVVDVRAHSGVVSYEPSELVITARAGTRLADLKSVMAERGQMLGFEPPSYADDATLGGTIACGFSGPRRPYSGAARDFVLGTRVINGRGELMRFGGQVMKNVAGYDVSRLMVGALGTLGVIAEVSLKVLPIPAREATVRLSLRVEDAIRRMNEWAGQPIPVSATCHYDDNLWVRLSGSEKGIAAAMARIGGDAVDDVADFWTSIREHRHAFFDGVRPLWRLSVPQGSPPCSLDGDTLIEWGGGQRWLKTEASAETIRADIARMGGHAVLFRGGDRSSEVFQPLHPGVLELHRNLKDAFDPERIFNCGRMYEDF